MDKYTTVKKQIVGVCDYQDNNVVVGVAVVVVSCSFCSCVLSRCVPFFLCFCFPLFVVPVLVCIPDVLFSCVFLSVSRTLG